MCNFIMDHDHMAGRKDESDNIYKAKYLMATFDRQI